MNLLVSAVVMGKGCEPGKAERGTLLQVVEHAIRDKLRDDPRDFDLGGMEQYVNSLQVVQNYSFRGCTIHYTFVQKCIEAHRHSEMPFVPGTSAGSRTSPSGRGSRSVTSRSVASHETSASLRNANERLVPIRITTADDRPRTALAHKAEDERNNFISVRIAGECGYTREPGSVINVTLTLVGESRECSLHVQDMPEELVLKESLLIQFGSYIPEYSMSDYLNTPEDSMRDSTTVTNAARSARPPLGQVGSRTRVHGGRPESRQNGFGSSTSTRYSGESDDPRVHEAWMGLAAHLSSRSQQA
ncbi:hypothetical protein F5Y15DRAFT_266417 [Xylariaceae sp. FL0016]|nr:hypothetical protein F5Y15DRAFT_266417 [Xylariaceae sp. FL0016]